MHWLNSNGKEALGLGMAKGPACPQHPVPRGKNKEPCLMLGIPPDSPVLLHNTRPFTHTHTHSLSPSPSNSLIHTLANLPSPYLLAMVTNSQTLQMTFHECEAATFHPLRGEYKVITNSGGLFERNINEERLREGDRHSQTEGSRSVSPGSSPVAGYQELADWQTNSVGEKSNAHWHSLEAMNCCGSISSLSIA